MVGRSIGRVALLLAFALALVVHATWLRSSLQDQLARQQLGTAIAWADAVRGAPRDIALKDVATRFEGGGLQRVRWRDADGTLLLDLAVEPSKPGVPNWFARALPIRAAAGMASVEGVAAGPPARIEVVLPASSALEALWASAWRAAVLLAACASAVALAIGWTRRSCRQSLADAATQAEALAEGRPATGAVKPVPELRRLNEVLANVIRRLRDAVDAQAAQVELLQRQAHLDAVTGMPNRRHFVSRLEQALAETGAPGGGLLIVRIVNLEALNQRLGHDSADRALAALGDLLQTYPQRVAGAFVGRLNGRDFALYLPAAGVLAETAASLRGAVLASPAGTVGGAESVFGGVDGLSSQRASVALAAADAALARAETLGTHAIEVHLPEDFVADPTGSRAWRQQIAAALTGGRIALAENPVHGASGALLHLECPLQLQFEAGGPFRSARRWLALAARSRLLPQIDLAALGLALQAIARDGRPRCVHMATASLATSGFVDSVQRRLEAHPAAAQRLWIDVAEGPSDGPTPQLREAAAAWRRCGVRLGIEHAGGALQGLVDLQPLGVEHIKIDARFVRGVAAEAPVREFARSLVVLVHGMGLQVIAEGVDDPADLAALWSLGFDGAAGAAVDAG